MENSDSPELFELGIIVPLHEEFEALTRTWTHVEDRHVGHAYFHVLEGRVSPVKAVAFVMDDMGIAQASLAVEKMLKHFRMPLLVLFGLAGSMGNDVNLGDVVVGDQIFHYLHRSKADEGKPDAVTSDESWDLNDLKVAPRVFRTDPKLLLTVTNFRRTVSGSKLHESWKIEALTRMPSDLAHDVSEHVVDVASGDIVGASPSFKSRLLEINRKFGAIEMEAAGFFEALQSHDDVNGLMVRGISDKADHTKSDTDENVGETAGDVRRFAASNAAGFLDTLMSWNDFRAIAERGFKDTDALRQKLYPLTQTTGAHLVRSHGNSITINGMSGFENPALLEDSNENNVSLTDIHRNEWAFVRDPSSDAMLSDLTQPSKLDVEQIKLLIADGKALLDSAQSGSADAETIERLIAEWKEAVEHALQSEPFNVDRFYRNRDQLPEDDPLPIVDLRHRLQQLWKIGREAWRSSSESRRW